MLMYAACMLHVCIMRPTAVELLPSMDGMQIWPHLSVHGCASGTDYPKHLKLVGETLLAPVSVAAVACNGSHFWEHLVVATAVQLAPAVPVALAALTDPFDPRA